MKKLLDCIEYIKAKEIVEILIAVGVLVGFIILSSIFAKIIMKCFKIKSDTNIATTIRFYGNCNKNI